MPDARTTDTACVSSATPQPLNTGNVADTGRPPQVPSSCTSERMTWSASETGALPKIVEMPAMSMWQAGHAAQVVAGISARVSPDICAADGSMCWLTTC